MFKIFQLSDLDSPTGMNVGDPDSLPRESMNRAREVLRLSYELPLPGVAGSEKDRALLQSFEDCKNIRREQERIEADGTDTVALTKAFNAFTKLESVHLHMAGGAPSQHKINRLDFDRTSLVPNGDFIATNMGVHHLLSICKALLGTSQKLKRLTASDIGYELMRVPPHRREIIKQALSGLRTFRLAIANPGEETAFVEDFEDELEEVREDASEAFGSGTLKELITAMPKLQVLKMLFPDAEIVQLKDVVGTYTWERLREFGISNVIATEHSLARFLLRHAGTLRRLSLSYVHLERGNWRSF